MLPAQTDSNPMYYAPTYSCCRTARKLTLSRDEQQRGLSGISDVSPLCLPNIILFSDDSCVCRVYVCMFCSGVVLLIMSSVVHVGACMCVRNLLMIKNSKLLLLEMTALLHTSFLIT